MTFKQVGCPEVKMGVLKFQGHSDDVVGVSGWLDDELSPDKWMLIGDVLLVRFAFENVGTGWVVQTAMANENVKVPYAVSLTYEGYSPILTVECPVGTSLKIESDDDDEEEDY
jgi:hypothetical protein